MYSPSPLLEALDAIRASVESAAHLLLFLDFDGTLAPIAATPQRAQLPPATRAILSQLARRADCTVSIVSGRALDDVRERVGIADLIYAGNHGLEISGGGLCFDESKAVRLKDDIKAVVDALTTGLGQIPGILVESKRLSASVHYRLVPDLSGSEVEHVVKAIVPEDHPNFVVVAGKMVWEVRPRVAWNKGTAVRWIRQQLGLMHALAFYLGDDRTDEDAFAEIGRQVTARVGASQTTLAGYRVADTEEVAAFLGWLAGTGRLAELP